MKLHYTAGFLLGSLFFCFCFNCCAQTPQESEVIIDNDTIPLPATDTLSAVEKEELPEKNIYSIIGVGDMMLGTNFPSPVYLPKNDGKNLLDDVREELKDADVTFGNLEGVLLDKGGTAKRCNNPDLCYAFRSPQSYGKHFADAGFDFVSLANNHSGDFGPTGRLRTKQTLDNLGIAYSGLAGTDEYTIIERAGKKWGMAAFAPNSGTTDVRNLKRAQVIVSELSKKCDFVIVSFHGGAEGAKNQHITRKTETYYGENRGNVYKFARAVIDAGADVVFGHGPHVTRAADIYKDRFIIYSLGNFCTYGRFNLRGVAGIAPMLKVYIDEEGIFQHAEVTSVYQMKAHGPRKDEQKRAFKVLKELTNTDIPDVRLEFHENSTITPLR